MHTKRDCWLRGAQPGLCNHVLTYPLNLASVCRLFTIVFIYNGVHDTLRLVLFVSTGFCRLAFFSVCLTTSHLATC
jgi:hypothetical protein